MTVCGAAIIAPRDHFKACDPLPIWVWVLGGPWVALGWPKRGPREAQASIDECFCFQQKLEKGRVGVALVGFADLDRSTPGIRRSPSTALRALAFGHRQGTMTVCGAAVIAPRIFTYRRHRTRSEKQKLTPMGKDRVIGTSGDRRGKTSKLGVRIYGDHSGPHFRPALSRHDALIPCQPRDFRGFRKPLLFLLASLILLATISQLYSLATALLQA